MASAPDAVPSATPDRTRPRFRWFWAAVLAALGVWLLILLWLSHDREPRPTQTSTPPGFNPQAAAVLSRRHEVVVQKPSGVVPPRIDRAESK